MAAAARTRKPTLEITPTTLATFQLTVVTVQLIVWVVCLYVTYLQFPVQVCFSAMFRHRSSC